MAKSSIDVSLTKRDMDSASRVGCWRYISAVLDGREDAFGLEKGANGWALHIEGACGELAVAKALNLFWDGSVNTFKQGGDVGDMQVRTRSEHHYELLVRPGDRDDDIFILVTGLAPRMRLRGWMFGGEAKQQQFLKTHGDRKPAYFVPNAILRELKELEPHLPPRFHQAS